MKGLGYTYIYEREKGEREREREVEVVVDEFPCFLPVIQCEFLCYSATVVTCYFLHSGFILYSKSLRFTITNL